MEYLQSWGNSEQETSAFYTKIVIWKFDLIWRDLTLTPSKVTLDDVIPRLNEPKSTASPLIIFAGASFLAHVNGFIELQNPQKNSVFQTGVSIYEKVRLRSKAVALSISAS